MHNVCKKKFHFGEFSTFFLMIINYYFFNFCDHWVISNAILVKLARQIPCINADSLLWVELF
mgnify:CR=1 FL=1